MIKMMAVVSILFLMTACVDMTIQTDISTSNVQFDETEATSNKSTATMFTSKKVMMTTKTHKSTVTSTVTAIEVSKETKKTVVLPKQVFKVEKITRVTFYGFGGAGQGVNVPSESMKEIVNWLGTFSVGEKVSEFPPLPPGTGEIVVEIVYADGTIVKQPLQLVEVSGVAYYTKCGDEPACYREILSCIKPLRSVTP